MQVIMIFISITSGSHPSSVFSVSSIKKPSAKKITTWQTLGRIKRNIKNSSLIAEKRGAIFFKLFHFKFQSRSDSLATAHLDAGVNYSPATVSKTLHLITKVSRRLFFAKREIPSPFMAYTFEQKTWAVWRKERNKKASSRLRKRDRKKTNWNVTATSVPRRELRRKSIPNYPPKNVSNGSGLVVGARSETRQKATWLRFRI